MRAVATSLLCSFMLLCCTPAPAIELQGGNVTLTEADRETLATCKRGECAVWSESDLAKLLAMYRAKLMREELTCRRNSI